MTLEERLSKSSLGAGLRHDQLEVLAGRAQERLLTVGEAALSRQDANYPLIVLLEGEAEVRGLFGQSVSVLKPGALIGEVAFLDRGPRTADVVATKESRVAVFPEDLIAWLNLEHPDITAQILYNVGRVLSSKLRWAQRLIDADDATNPYPDR